MRRQIGEIFHKRPQSLHFERQFDAGAEAEDSVADHLDDAFTKPGPIAFLSAAEETGQEIRRVPFETQTSHPFDKTNLLPRESGRPRWTAIC